jgi:hypothetical protein
MWKSFCTTWQWHEDRYTFLIISRSFHIIMENVSENSCRQNQNTHFRIIPFFRETCRLWDNVEKLLYKLTITGILHEDRYTFLIISRSFLIIMKNISDKRFRESQNTYFRFSANFFVKFAYYEIMWKYYYTTWQ